MRVRWLVLGNWTFGWKTASKNSTASRGKVLFREHLACLNLATLTRFGSWIYPHLALLKRFCSLLGSHFQIWRTLWDRGEKALCTWPLQSKREQNISTGPGLPRLRGQSPAGKRWDSSASNMQPKERINHPWQGHFFHFKHSLRTSEMLFTGLTFYRRGKPLLLPLPVTPATYPPHLDSLAGQT